ncbi:MULTISPECIES: toll/interleukin-1 receptor domain-containing protein [unclassified Streptomyces]|uniref:toll/interleukin-1 receptor domain-containing protein n=1 Tax=unclassified Streptomyces TaxID=2593676 RepID=UPI003802319B
MGEVFISHSARGDASATDVLGKIVRELEAKGHTPLVDQSDIPPGEEWRAEVVDWLARCDAAVVLLNEKALRSTWVRREVNILMWRRALGAPLLVIPVLLEGLGTGAVKDAGMEELRPVQFARTPSGEEYDIGEIAGQVLERFSELPHGTRDDDPMSAWLTELGVYLEETRASPRLLVKAAKALKIEDEHLPTITGRHDGCLFLAHQFLVAPPARMARAIGILAPVLSDQTISRLAGALSATWVNEEAARNVLPPPGGPPHAMTLLLNAHYPETAEDYVRRATCGNHIDYEVKSTGTLPLGEDRVGERVSSWEDAVWKLFFDAESEDDRWLPDDLDERTHYLIVNEQFGLDEDFADAVGLLHGLFSWLIVLVTTGTPPPAQRVQDRFENAVLLKPLLTEVEEQTARLRKKKLSDLPRRLTGTY